MASTEIIIRSKQAKTDSVYALFQKSDTTIIPQE